MKIYQSRWIPRPTSFKKISRATLPVEATVSTLIDKEHKWNENLIKQHFDHEDAEKILKIPLPRAPKLDPIIWAYDKQGRYAVKSGYQIVMSLKFKDQLSSSTASPTEWNAIRKLEISEKVKVFMWRAAQYLLPTAGNLWKKKALHDP